MGSASQLLALAEEIRANRLAALDEACAISKAKVGDKVKHPNYGTGTVSEVDKKGGQMSIDWDNGDQSHPKVGAGMLRQLVFVESEAGSANLTEDVQILARPELLSECEAYPSYMAARTPDEKIREAIGSLKYTIQDAAFEGLTDDGKTLRALKDGEDDPWAAIEKMVLAEINVNKIKSMIERGKVILAGYKA